MTGIDTNILVRYFVQDDAVQSRKAQSWIETKVTEEHPGFVSVVTMAEMVWVLGGTYGFSSVEIAGAIERMLQTGSFVIQNEQEVFEAVSSMKTGQGEFADLLIAALGTWAGCASTVTFDRKAARLPGFELLS